MDNNFLSSVRIFMLCGLSNSAMPMKSITQTRWNRGRSTRNNSWHQILPSKISWKEKKKKKRKGILPLEEIYTRDIRHLVLDRATTAGHRRWTRLAFGHRSREEASFFPLVSPLSSRIIQRSTTPEPSSEIRRWNRKRVFFLRNSSSFGIATFLPFVQCTL